ncbi:MAG: dihydrofolate reductase family protein [Actinobacteria bacterium]|nr:dihydrofolate reductase family protein [Actinomycetota bacterium]
MKVVISEFTSLDGVVQAPGGADEDTSGGFRHGGWWMPYFDPEVMGPVIEGFAERCEALLQGRRTYQVSAAAWPERSGGFADWINAAQKYVVSDTLDEADVATWTPTTIIPVADLVRTVSELRARDGGDVYVYGSLTVSRTLLAAGLVDELILMVGPVTLGGGKRLFADNGEARRFRLIEATPASTGALVCRYQPQA